MELEQCIINRRSIRRFQKTPVQYEDIVAMVDAARWAPSWKNSQVTRYYAVLQEDRKNQIAQSMPAFNQIACLEARFCLWPARKKRVLDIIEMVPLQRIKKKAGRCMMWAFLICC